MTTTVFGRAAACAALLAGIGAASAVSAQTTPFYMADGDSSIAYIIQNGAVQSSFATYSVAYPLSVRDTVIIHNVPGTNAVEYDLAGAPTGNSYVGVGGFDQLLDGTTDGVQYNYAIQCCSGANSVIRTNLTWEGGAVLFALPGGYEGSGIAYDTTDDTLWAVNFNTAIVTHFSLSGAVLGTVALPGSVSSCCLAYEESTDTLWVFDRAGNDLIQFDPDTGAVLATVDIPGFAPNNPYGGEMAIAGGAPPPPPAVVPTLTEWAMMLLAGLMGLGALAAVRRRFTV